VLNDRKNDYYLAGKQHKFERPAGAIDSSEDIVGCGILLNSKNELSVFFTLDGTLIGKLLLITHIINDFIK
jgi:hypothetical protein